MARWLRMQTRSYEDLPKRLRWRHGESRERRIQRSWWLESNGLSVVDYFGWLSAERGPRPPARRRHLSPEQLAELDARREQEPTW